MRTPNFTVVGANPAGLGEIRHYMELLAILACVLLIPLAAWNLKYHSSFEPGHKWILLSVSLASGLSPCLIALIMLNDDEQPTVVLWAGLFILTAATALIVFFWNRWAEDSGLKRRRDVFSLVFVMMFEYTVAIQALAIKEGPLGMIVALMFTGFVLAGVLFSFFVLYQFLIDDKLVQ